MKSRIVRGPDGELRREYEYIYKVETTEKGLFGLPRRVVKWQSKWVDADTMRQLKQKEEDDAMKEILYLDDILDDD